MGAGLKGSAGAGLGACGFVAFDFDGTLTSYVDADTRALESLRQAAAPQVPAAEFLARAIAEIMAFHARVERGESDPLSLDSERLGRTLEAYGEALMPEHLARYRAALEDATVPLPGARELLHGLKARGLRLALLTNAYDGPAQRRRVRACFPEEPFEVIVVAGEVGALKPDPRPFQAMLEALGARASQGLYVGDSPEHDVAGARGVGLRAVLVHAHPGVQARGRALGADQVVPDLPALAEALGLA